MPSVRPGRAALLGCLMLLPAVLAAQQADSTPMERFQAIGWEAGPATGRLGETAEVWVPEACRFTGAAGTKTFMEITENPSADEEVGTIFCADRRADVDGSWFVVFAYDQSGYVKDDEKEELDADAILASLKQGNEAGNEARAERGWAPIHLIGWDRPPFYDASTNNLTWATLLRSDEGGETVNHSVRLLGRGGVMHVDLVVSPDEKVAAMATFDSIVSGFTYVPGHRYAEWREGDKIAAYGLTALVAGGAGAVAVKTGLFAKLGKLLIAGAKVLVVGAIALVAWLKSLFSGRNKSATAEAGSGGA